MPVAKTKISYTISLPVAVVQAVESSKLKPTQKSKAYKFIAILLNNMATGKMDKEFTSHAPDMNDYRQLSATYFRKVFKDGRHQQWVNVLKNLKIVQVKKSVDDFGNARETYQPGTHNKAYRLNLDMLTSEYVDTKYEILQDADEDQFVNIKNELWDVDILFED